MKINLTQICFIAFIVLISSNLHAGEKEYCSRNVVCISEITHRRNKVVEFTVRNKENFPVTVTFGMKELINMNSNVELPHTLTLRPNQSKKLAALTVKNFSIAWRWWFNWNWKPGPIKGTHSGHIYSLPYAPGQSYRVTKGYNEPDSHLHADKYCIDWDMPEGTPIYAARGGIVGDVISEFWENGGAEFGKMANYVWIIHNDGTGGVYLHLKQDGSNVTIGQSVKQGDLIGWSGNTGYSDGPHLHFGVYRVIDGWNSYSVPIKFRNGKHTQFIPQKNHFYRRDKD